MQLKKIDTTSENYQKIRSAISWVSGAGAGLTLECMSIPWVKTIFKSRIARGVCLSGIVPMATLVSLLSKGTSETIVDAYAECWNMLADKVNGRETPDISEWFSEQRCEDERIQTKETYKGIDIPDADASSEVEKKFIDDVIAADSPFSFETEEEAKHFVEWLFECIEKCGHADIAEAFAMVGKQLPTRLYDIALRFGWTDTKGFGIEQIGENRYMATVYNYHDISNVYETLKED